MTEEVKPNLYDLVLGVINDWSEYNRATGPVQQAEVIQRLNNTIHKLRDMDLVWDIAEQKLYHCEEVNPSDPQVLR